MDTNNPSVANGSDKTQAATSAVNGAIGSAKDTAQTSGATLRSQLVSLKTELDALVNRAPALSDDELSQEHARLMSQFSSLRYAAKGIASQASQQFNRTVQTASLQFNRGMETASQQFSRGMETTTGYVKDKPMQSVAVAAGAGLILGFLFKRR